MSMRLACLALLLCACSRTPTVTELLELRAEPTLRSEGVVVLENGSRPMIVGDLLFEPDDLPIRRISGSDWEVAARDTREVGLRFEPQTEGVWDGALVFVTSEGELSTALHLVAEVGTDLDGDGWSAAMGDCDDNDATSWVDAPELCDGVDNDCDTEVDEDFDWDRDGHLDLVACAAVGGDDCDDEDRTAHPGHAEDCDNTDSDCNGVVDDIPDLADRQDGICEGLHKECTFGGPIEPDYPALLPAFQWIETRCDEVDNDCDGGVDDFDRLGDGTSDCTDDDGDGEREVDGDCDDTDPGITSADCGPTRLLVTSLADGYAVIDLITDTSTTVEVGTLLYDAAPIGDDHYLVTDRFGLVADLDLGAGALVDAEVLNSATWSAVAAPDGTVVYVAGQDGLVWAIEPTDLAVVDAWGTQSGATGLVMDEAGLLWACTTSGWLHRIDVARGEVDSVQTGLGCYGPPIVDSARDRVLVLGYGSGFLGAVDRATLEAAEPVFLDTTPNRGVLTDDALWLAGGGEHTIARVDPDTLAVVDLWDLGGHVTDVWWDGPRRQLWATLYDADAVVRLDPDTGIELGRHALSDPALLRPAP